MKNSITTLLFLILFGNVYAQTTLNENFESWPPQNWELYELGDGGEWVHSMLYGGGMGYNGSECAVHKISNDYCDNWLVSPMIEVINGNYELNFHEYSDDLAYYNWAGVYISTGSNDPNSGDFAILVESIQVEETWSLQTIDLSSFNGENIYIAFVFNGTWSQYRIDNVNIAPSNIVDGALTEIVSPNGVNQNGGLEDVIVKLVNYGSQPINEGSIDWNINSDNGTFDFSGLNVSPGNEQNIIITNYNFSAEGEYLMNATLNLTDDFDESNNYVEGSYYITDPKDAEATALYPNGYFPIELTEMAQIKVTNRGEYNIEQFSVNWTFNGDQQTDVIINGINLLPGEFIIVDLANIDIINGLNTIEADIILGEDINPDNNNRIDNINVGNLWEGFEGELFPPEQWQADDYPYKDYFFPVQGEFYYYSQVDNNIFGSISDTLFTPLLNIEAGDIITFKLWNSGFYPTMDYLIWKDGATGEIHMIDEIDSDLEQWDEVSMDISSAAGNNYIGFAFNEGGSYGYSMLDLITSTASIHQFDNDLGIINFNFESFAVQNMEHIFELNLRNYGLNTVSGADYSILLQDEDGNTLVTQNGVDLDSWESTIININHSFDETINTKINALIDFANDDFNENNQTINYHFSVAMENTIQSNIGSAEAENLMIPFDSGGDTWTLGDADISQQLYYQSELNTNGFIHGIRIYYNESMAIGQTFPLQLKMMETDLNDLSGGWIPQENLSIVFNGEFDVYPGIRSIYIPFNEPYLYSGQNNIVIQFHQYDPSWPSTLARFYSSEGDGQIRGIRLNNVYDLDINDLPDYWGEHTDHTFITFVFEEPSNSGIISGTITNINNEPVSNAKVIVNNTNISVISDDNGYYEFPELPYESYTLTASAYGYEDLSQEIDLENTQQTLNFQLQNLPLVAITGIVFGSDSPATPLSDVEIILGGYSSNTINTDANGVFTFTDIFGNQDYNITIEETGYQEYQQEFMVESDNFDLGDIILQNDFYCAFNVMTVPGSNQAFVNWEAPLTRIEEKLQYDSNIPSYSLTNEPYENVWLGNFFENNEMITLTSVEVVWDIYELSHDLVSIDIVNESGEVIVSSLVFQTWNDSTMTIDIPNISISENFYAMVHWQNNEESTDPLALDYNEGTPNTAYIMYPNEEPVLLSTFLGSPDASFMIRVNTLKEDPGKSNNMDISYNIYRGPVAEINLATNLWDPINSAPVNDLSYMDDDWDNVGEGQYTYGIEALYNDGEAEFSFSNFFEIITGLEESESQNLSLKVYPNPASDLIFIEGVTGQEIQIYNQIGQLIESIVLPNNLVKKSLVHYQPGVYIIRVKDTMLSYKFIKE